jgi:hypothetical protein
MPSLDPARFARTDNDATVDLSSVQLFLILKTPEDYITPNPQSHPLKPCHLVHVPLLLPGSEFSLCRGVCSSELLLVVNCC